ncbi:hypothetical protein K435DRAFT_870493 [Dendrothele bispora CBS 962.96]|uniref:Uncharacterized protein n=1 Tax=Dendrothele bispora (strain CBS 962.96) TaxID=1314807 RepID=A0A4S8L6F3_DENBC|nr:hypothetical protein K435DRAFT_870493 [Dendrothele bispora CBS 962.96]
MSVSARFDSSFARGYNDALQDVGISEKMLLNFIDGLNLAIVASPPLRVVDVVGNIIGFVPSHWAMIASIAITTAAQTGMRVLSKTLSDRYLRAANLRLFKPRGLSVRLCTTPALLALLSSAGGAESSKKSGKEKAKSALNKVGRTVGTVLLQAPIPYSSRIVRAIADKPPVIAPIPGESMEHMVVRRRLAFLVDPEGDVGGEHGHGHGQGGGRDLALRLRLDGLEPPKKPEGVMEMVNTWGVKLDERKEKKKERRNKQRRRALQMIDQEVGEGRRGYEVGASLNAGIRASTRSSLLSSSSSLSSSSQFHSGSHSPGYSAGAVDMSPMDSVSKVWNDRQERKAARREIKEVGRELRARHKAERRAMKREWKNERRALRGLPPRPGGGLLFGPEGLVSAVLGPKQTPMQRRVANANLLEHWANEDVLWIVVMNGELDREIEGIEVAESLEDEERVDERSWRAEMEREREELMVEIESSSDSDSEDEHHKGKRRV